MKLHYRKRQLYEIVHDTQTLKKKYGARNCEEIQRTIYELECADFLGDIPQKLRPHPLIAKSNIYSADVEHPNRLLFIPVEGTYDPKNPLGTIKEIEILEISINTHDKKFNPNKYL